jgi:hypothetical protein
MIDGSQGYEVLKLHAIEPDRSKLVRLPLMISKRGSAWRGSFVLRASQSSNSVPKLWKRCSSGTPVGKDVDCCQTLCCEKMRSCGMCVVFRGLLYTR